MVANILPAAPPPHHLTLGSKDQNSTFSEHGHTAFQSKWTQQHGSIFLPADPPPPNLTLGSKGQNSTFSEHSHIAD